MIVNERSACIEGEMADVLAAVGGDVLGADVDVGDGIGAAGVVRLRAEARVLAAEASARGVEIGADQQLTIDGLLGASRPVLDLPDVRAALGDLTERVTDAGVRAALREEMVAAAEATFAATGYERARREMAADGTVTLLFVHETGREGQAAVAPAGPSDPTVERADGPVGELTIDIIDEQDAVGPEDPAAGQPCEAAGHDALAIHERLPDHSPGLVFGMPQQNIKAVRGVTGRTSPAGSRTSAIRAWRSARAGKAARRAGGSS